LTDAWLRNTTNYNAWVLGTKKALRFYSADNVGINNRSLVAYKAAPTAERSCGTSTFVGNFLGGNAKIYDSVRYDQFPVGNILERTNPFTFICPLNIAVTTTNANLLTLGKVLDATSRSIRLQIANNKLRLHLNGTGRLVVNSTLDMNSVGQKVLGITYTGSGTFAGVKMYLDGVPIAITLQESTLTGTLFPYASGVAEIGARQLIANNFLNGKIKQMELLNVVLSDAEMLLAGTQGSARAAGYPHNGGNYLIAPDFDKTDGNPLTTYASTPSYTITPIGATNYTPFI